MKEEGDSIPVIEKCCSYVDTHTHIYTYTHTHTYTHIHKHVWKYDRFLSKTQSKVMALSAPTFSLPQGTMC